LGPPSGKDCIVFVDDVSLPLPEKKSGAQPAIELLRQIQEFKGFYDRRKLHWEGLERTVLCLAAPPPSSGRRSLPSRFTRHSYSLCLFDPDEISIQRLFMTILQGFFDSQ
ncbi:atpase family associated with various cellular activities domain-containing protein, partial [Cystoisospora suis]